MIDVIVLDLCAVLLAPELRVKLVMSQAEKDGLRLFCYADLPRKTLRRALRVRGLLEGFDGLLYAELMSQLTSDELRRLGDKSKTFWMLTPESVDYNAVLPLLGPRQRPLPRALRLLGTPIADQDKFPLDAE